jgi:hypothetical protein
MVNRRVLSFRPYNPANDSFLQWRFSPISGVPYVKIKSVSSSQWLDGRDKSGSIVLVSDSSRNPDTDQFLQWEIHHLWGNIYGIKSVSSGCWLDGRHVWTRQVPWVSDGTRNPKTDLFLQFEIMLLE